MATIKQVYPELETVAVDNEDLRTKLLKGDFHAGKRTSISGTLYVDVDGIKGKINFKETQIEGSKPRGRRIIVAPETAADAPPPEGS